MTRDGRLIEQDEHVLRMTLYFTNELRLLIERAGFTDVDVFGDYTSDAATRDSGVVVFVARKPD